MKHITNIYLEMFNPWIWKTAGELNETTPTWFKNANITRTGSNLKSHFLVPSRAHLSLMPWRWFDWMNAKCIWNKTFVHISVGTKPRPLCRSPPSEPTKWMRTLWVGYGRYVAQWVGGRENIWQEGRGDHGGVWEHFGDVTGTWGWLGVVPLCRGGGSIRHGTTPNFIHPISIHPFSDEDG